MLPTLSKRWIIHGLIYRGKEIMPLHSWAREPIKRVNAKKIYMYDWRKDEPLYTYLCISLTLPKDPRAMEIYIIPRNKTPTLLACFSRLLTESADTTLLSFNLMVPWWSDQLHLHKKQSTDIAPIPLNYVIHAKGGHHFTLLFSPHIFSFHNQTLLPTPLFFCICWMGGRGTALYNYRVDTCNYSSDTIEVICTL